MASEIRVDKINSLSGVGTVTLSPTGADISGITTVSTLKVGTGVTASSDGDIFFTGIATATTFSGSGASLTALPAGNLTGTVADARISTLTASKLSGALPAISALNLTNVPAANVVGVHTSLNITGSTTTGTAVVGGGVTISESGIEASGIGITCANINGTQIGGRRNIIINGAMLVAQRGTSSTTSDSFTVDRFKVSHSGTDEAPTYAQVDVSSGTTPYTLGFRKALRVTNGNQTSGAGGGDFINIGYTVEAQDIANSGWNIPSSSSFITLSFWVKSSVAQNFYGYLRTMDGTNRTIGMETGSLSANTWTKVTKTIPGDSFITINNDNGSGLQIFFGPFWGTNRSDNSVSLTAWRNYGSGLRTKDATTTWYTTNDATFELTGVQLEVGSQATSFEHRSFGEELALCQRYCQVLGGNTVQELFMYATGNGSTTATGFYQAPVDFRATPSFSISNLSHVNIYNFTNSGNLGSPSSMSLITAMSAKHWVYIDSPVSGTTSGGGIMVRANSTTDARFTLTAEL